MARKYLIDTYEGLMDQSRLHPGVIVSGTISNFNDSAVGNDAYREAVGGIPRPTPRLSRCREPHHILNR